MFRRRPPHAASSAEVVPLSRAQLLGLLAGLLLVGGVLLYGLGYTLVSSFSAGTAADGVLSSVQPDADPAQRRDLIAAEPMATVAQDASLTPGVAIALPPAIGLPAATTVGASGVPSGYPRTPEGAAAQLAAIEVRVLSAMSLPLATEIYRDWAMPGGAGAADWSQTRNVQSFLTHARQSSNVLDPGTLISVTPAAIQIKGTDGPDWVVACVLLDVRVALKAEARMGYGTCERMQWTGDRWLIGPGAPPAPAPSRWPGSDASVEAGWQPVASN
ncbi:MAG: hypothetical protein GX440_05740 [Propionibacterium sp.]|nr:hypothetical protein [Propionibacterium sp.]